MAALAYSAFHFKKLALYFAALILVCAWPALEGGAGYMAVLSADQMDCAIGGHRHGNFMGAGLLHSAHHGLYRDQQTCGDALGHCLHGVF